MLNRHRITTQDIKDVKEGEASIPAVVKRILKRYVGMGEQDKAQGFNLAPKKLSSFLRAAKTGKGALDFFSGSKSLVKFFAPAAVAGGVAYLHKNRERFTGYPTQVAYEQAQQGRIDASRAQMRLAPKTKQNLKINWERQGFNDDEIREKERKYDEETAELLGATVIDDQIILGQDYFPDLGGKDKDVIKAPTDIVQFPGEDEIIKAEFDRVVAENKAKAEAEAAAQRAYAARVPDPIYHQPSGNGDRHGGGGGQASADRGGGSSYSSPFEYGGPVYVYKRNNHIDKALKGRKRDI